MMQHISKMEIVERLDEVLGAKVGMRGLNTLLSGWNRKDPQRRINISHRRWLYGYEVQELSAYAGYDLRPRKYNSICGSEYLHKSEKSSIFALSFGEIG